MLFTYQFIEHSMVRIQEYTEYIFYEVWCKAPEVEYDISLFNHHADLKLIIEEFYYMEYKSADFFVRGIQEVFTLFKTLSKDEIDQLKIWYQSNNDIEHLCMNDPSLSSSTYKDIKQMNANLSASLYSFYIGLYSHNFLSLKAITDNIGEIGNHYKEFIKVNSRRKCPYCGLQPIDGQYVHTREAYDHYLPKSKYPFSSINFKNLAPICSKCNSGYKGTKDPLYDKDGARRKAFYSYNVNPNIIEIEIRLNSKDIKNLTPQDIDIRFGPTSAEEEIKTWNDLFGIEERYKDECCSEDGWYWLTQIFDERGDKTPSEFLEIQLEYAEKNPYRHTNFLRKPFLEACAALDIFKHQPPR